MPPTNWKVECKEVGEEVGDLGARLPHNSNTRVLCQPDYIHLTTNMRPQMGLPTTGLVYYRLGTNNGALILVLTYPLDTDITPYTWSIYVLR